MEGPPKDQQLGGKLAYPTIGPYRVLERRREGREYKLQHLTTGEVDAYATIHMHPYPRDQSFDELDTAQQSPLTRPRPPSAALRESDAAAPCDRRVPHSCRAAVLPFAVRARPVVRNTGWAKMSRKAKFMLDEHRTPDGDGQAGAGGEEDRVLSPTTNQRAAPRGDLTGSESRRRATTGERASHAV